MNEMKLIPREANLEITDAYGEYVEKVLLVADKYGLDRNYVMKTAIFASEILASNIDFTDFKIKEKNNE